MIRTLTRALIEPPVVQSWLEDGGSKIGHIVLSEFNEKSIAQMQRAYANLNAQGMRALVFDLRYNPGGLLNSAVDVCGQFLPPGQMVHIDGGGVAAARCAHLHDIHSNNDCFLSAR